MQKLHNIYVTKHWAVNSKNDSRTPLYTTGQPKRVAQFFITVKLPRAHSAKIAWSAMCICSDAPQMQHKSCFYQKILKSSGKLAKALESRPTFRRCGTVQLGHSSQQKERVTNITLALLHNAIFAQFLQTKGTLSCWTRTISPWNSWKNVWKCFASTCPTSVPATRKSGSSPWPFLASSIAASASNLNWIKPSSNNN